MSAFYETELNEEIKEDTLETTRHYDEEDRLSIPTNRATKKPK